MNTLTLDNDTLRPQSLGTYVGQQSLKEMVVAHVDAALAENRRLPHVLLLGPPGSGKTTLAHIIAGMVGARLHVMTAAPDIKRFIWALEELCAGGERAVLFIDEIHLLPPSVQDKTLLTLTEEQYIDTPYGTYHYPNLTVIGATTDRRKVRPALKTRFTLQPRWEDYTETELARIASDIAAKADLDVDWETCEAFGRASAGVPRQARTLVLHAKALATSRGTWTLDDALAMASVTEDGLTYDHVDYLRRLKEMGGIDVGLETLSERLGLEQGEVRNLEQLLLDRQLIARHRTGRALTGAGRARLAAA